jgi:hypothetical protein
MISPISSIWSRSCCAPTAWSAPCRWRASIPTTCFAGEDAEDIANCTNRSPYPTLHLIREASLARATAAFPDASEIYLRNIETMRALGLEGWQALDVGAPGTSKE